MSERCTLSEMADHLSAAAVEATEPVERGWLNLCERYDMAEWREVEPWEPEEAGGGRMTIGELIRKRRTEAGLSLRETARQCGISPSFLSRFERGGHETPSRPRLLALSDILDLNGDEVLALAGRVPCDLHTIIVDRPSEFCPLIRAMAGLSGAQIEQLTAMAKEMLL